MAREKALPEEPTKAEQAIHEKMGGGRSIKARWRLGLRQGMSFRC